MPMPECRYYDSFTITGQRYDRVGERPYTRKRDGQQTTVAVWQAPCRECGEPFQFFRTDKPVPIGPPRRCKACVAIAREARARAIERLDENGKFQRYKELPTFRDESGVILPAWLAGENGHPAPRPASHAGAEPPSATRHRAEANPPVAPPHPPRGHGAKSRDVTETATMTPAKGVFTDR